MLMVSVSIYEPSNLFFTNYLIVANRMTWSQEEEKEHEPLTEPLRSPIWVYKSQKARPELRKIVPKDWHMLSLQLHSAATATVVDWTQKSDKPVLQRGVFMCQWFNICHSQVLFAA